MVKKIFHLTIKKVWFDKIAKGEKDTEYRIVKPHWRSRLFGKNSNQPREFDEIHIRNGYSMDKPFMRIKWNGFTYAHYDGARCYAIDVSEVLEITNWTSD